ncbi:MAG: TldD/PmbA family protein [Chloroflexi bacterium]|nr:TldD/PmbA family protein [Chloroflexota bacterium]
MEAILAQAKKVAEEAEVFTVLAEETQVRFEANRLKHVQSRQTGRTALRIVKEGKMGYATTTEPGKVRALVDAAVETAQFGMEAKFKFPSSGSYPAVEVFDPDTEAAAAEEMVGLGEELMATVTGHTPDIVCEAGVSKGAMLVRIINSCGGQAEYHKSIFALDIEGSLIRDTDMLFVGDSQSSCHPLRNSGEVAESVLRQLELARDQARVPSGSLPVIFTPRGVAGALIPSLIAGFSGKTVIEGASPLAKNLGRRVFDNRLCLWDDATIAYQIASRPCDDEGVSSQRTLLIDRGVVANFFYDLQTAALAGTRSTGNASRHRGLPAPAPSAFVIDPGDTAFEQMVRDMKEGLVIEQLMGAEQGNILGGDFSGNVLLGYKVENGQIVGRVKDTMVSGNVYQALKQVIAIGSESRLVDGFVRAPHLYCASLAVAAR